MAVAAQAVFILAVAAAGFATTIFGRTITLRTAPVDPRDLLYGDYVVLNYRISELPMALWRGPARRLRNNQPVYVELRPAPLGHEPVAVYHQQPKNVAPGHTVLRGWVRSSWRRGMRVRYGLEKYFIPEGTGRGLEQQARRGGLLVYVSIAPWSQARITRVEVAPAEPDLP
jgi:uncharacterized membrane-anchored protein